MGLTQHTHTYLTFFFFSVSFCDTQHLYMTLAFICDAKIRESICHVKIVYTGKDQEN